MFIHPEGEIHPKAPSHKKRMKRYDFGELIFGNSPKRIETFFKAKNILRPEISLAKQVRDYIHHHENRKKYIEMAHDYLKTKAQNLRKVYDIVLVGAGVHSALYIYNLKKKNPNLKILVVEKDSTICSTFSKLGDSLVLNSPTFSKVGLNSNIMQGHFIQTSDFDEMFEKPFPTAKHLYELATMIHFHADSEILFDFETNDIDSYKERYVLEFQNKRVRTKNVIIANGMGQSKFDFARNEITASELITGDDFIAKSFYDENYFNSIEGKRIAVVGDGDTANSVMEYLLPLVYPNFYYGFYRKSAFLPKFVYWVGQKASDIQQYYFQNKTRYCHSGGVIEFFWNEETPFELSTEVWRKTKDLIKCIPGKLKSINKIEKQLKLITDSEELKVDLVIDCSGRINPLVDKFKKENLDFLIGKIEFYGGHWCDLQDSFIAAPINYTKRRIACRVENKNIFFLGCAAPLEQLIDDDEALNGASKYSEKRKTLTNSKWSLEHTLPRTVAFAENYEKYLFQ